MLHHRRGLWSVAAAIAAALCLSQSGCESLRNSPLAGDRNVPSKPWENTRLTVPQDWDAGLSVARAEAISLSADADF